MSREITHQVVEGRYVQIVSPERLRQILDDDGDNYSRPDHFKPGDEWKVAGAEEDAEKSDD